VRKLALPCCAFWAISTFAPALRGETWEYAEIPVVVVIYTNYEKDDDTFMHLSPEDVDALTAVVQDSVEFFWRSSNLKCHVNAECLVIDRTLTPEQMWFWGDDGGCWMPWWSMDGGATSVRDDVLAAGYQAGDVASVVALYAFKNDDEVWAAIGGGSYGMGCGVLGQAGYVGIPLCWGIENIDSYFIHEYLHQLDSIFDHSGNPEDMFHADHAHSFPYPDDCGRHFNFLISSTLDPQSWLQLGVDWSTVRTAPDDDDDGVPDSGDAPITEATLGTAVDNPDSDGDGLSDFAEIIATYHGMTDPLSVDSDGDTIRDGDDVYPLYRLSSSSVAYGTPAVDGVITPDEYTELARFDRWEPDIGAVTYARWTEDTLYFAADVTDETLVTWFTEPDWCDHFEISIDADRDDWFLDNDPGNYRFMVVPRGHDGHVVGHDYYYDAENGHWHEFDTQTVTRRYTLTEHGYLLEIAIPLELMPALDVQPGDPIRLTFDLVDIDQWEWPRYNVFSELEGDYPGFVELELAPAQPGDLNGDGCVDHADLGILLGNWGCSGADCIGDCDGDGDTDHADLGILLGNWGAGCP